MSNEHIMYRFTVIRVYLLRGVHERTFYWKSIDRRRFLSQYLYFVELKRWIEKRLNRSPTSRKCSGTDRNIAFPRYYINIQTFSMKKTIITTQPTHYFGVSLCFSFKRSIYIWVLCELIRICLKPKHYFANALYTRGKKKTREKNNTRQLIWSHVRSSRGSGRKTTTILLKYVIYIDRILRVEEKKEEYVCMKTLRFC